MSTPSLTKALVRILEQDREPREPVGAGFLVTPHHILTCAHVVASALRVEKNMPERPTQTVYVDFPILEHYLVLQSQVIQWYPVKEHPSVGEPDDIAVLELTSTLPMLAQPVSIVTLEDEMLFDRPVRMCGFPRRMDGGDWLTGTLQGVTASGRVQLDNESGRRAVARGFSGTAVWDKQENAVTGMIVGIQARAGDTSAYMIPATTLHKAWPALEQQSRPSNPYRGLFAFREQDERFFFGRNGWTQSLIAAVQNRSLVAVIGPSGSGKSSVVYAGMFPKLRRQGNWLITSFRPSDNPFQTIARALVPFLYTDELKRLRQAKELTEQLQLAKISLSDVITRVIEKDGQVTKFLLFVDQFEELYTPNHKNHDRCRFLDELLATARMHTSVCKIILTLRADFLGKALAYRPFADALQDADIKLGPMNRDELRETIEHPANALEVEIEDGLTDRMLDAVGDEPGSLSLLEFALTELWNRQTNGVLTHAAYEAVGGVEQALAAYAENVYTTLTDHEQTRAQRIFIQLVRPGEGTEDSRQIATRGYLGEQNWELVTKLANDRLVVTNATEVNVDKLNSSVLEKELSDVYSSEDTVELVHEALIQNWGRLGEWINADRKFRIWQEHLRRTIQQWERNKKDPGMLLRDAQLSEAKDWLGKRKHVLSPIEQTFIQRSLRKERHRRRTIRGLVATIMIVLSISLSITMNQWQNATRREQVARIRQLALQSQAVRQEFPQRSLLLAIAAVEMNEKATHSSISEPEQSLRDALQSMGGTGVSGQSREIDDIAISPDNRWLIARDGSGAVSLWDLTTSNISASEQLLYSSYSKAPASGAGDIVNFDSKLSPDGRWLLIQIPPKNYLQLWDLTKRDVPFTAINLPSANIITTAFSPDSQKLITGSMDGTLQSWELKNLTAENVRASGITLHTYSHKITNLVISSDSQYLISAIDNMTVSVWDLTTNNRVGSTATLHEYETTISDIAFSPDNQWILFEASTSRYEKRLLFWETKAIKKKEPLPLFPKDHDYRLMSPDGVWLITTTTDNSGKTSLHLWDISTIDGVNSVSSTALYEFSDSMEQVDISPDSQFLVAGAEDGIVRVWRLNTRDIPNSLKVLPGHKAEISKVVISNDSHWLITGSYDHTVRLWNLAELDGNLSPITLHGHESAIRDLDISSDGKLLATASENGFARIWNLTAPSITNSELLAQSSSSFGITEIAVSFDNHWLAAGCNDGSVRLYDLNVEEKLSSPLILNGHEYGIETIAFTPDSHYLFTGSRDGTIQRWDLSATDVTTSSVAIMKETWLPQKIKFRVDGRDFVASGSGYCDQCGTGKVIVGELTEPLNGGSAFRAWSFSGHTREITAVSISSDSHWVAVGYADGIVQLWSTNTQGSIRYTIKLDEHEHAVHAIAISSDNHYLATAAWDKTIRLWDLTSSDIKKSASTLYSEVSVMALNFSPNSRYLVAGNTKGEIQKWDMMSIDNIDNLSSPGILLHGHKSSIAGFSFSSEGHYLFSGSSDGQIWKRPLDTDKLLESACQSVGRNLSYREWQVYLPEWKGYPRVCPNIPIHWGGLEDDRSKDSPLTYVYSW